MIKWKSIKELEDYNEDLLTELFLLQHEINKKQEKIDRALSFICILHNNLKDYSEYEEYTNIFNEMLKDIEEILGGVENDM